MTQRRIGFLAFDGVRGLDLIGLADAFASDAFHEIYPKVQFFAGPATPLRE